MTPPDHSPDPDRIAHMEDAVRRLPRMQRKIFRAVTRYDCSYADIAAKTGLTLDQVERAFADSLVNLERNLEDLRRHAWRRWFG